MKDTMGPNALVLSLLLFVTLPSFPPPSPSNPHHMESFNALDRVRDEMETIAAYTRITTALRSKFLPAIKVSDTTL